MAEDRLIRGGQFRGKTIPPADPESIPDERIEAKEKLSVEDEIGREELRKEMDALQKRWREKLIHIRTGHPVIDTDLEHQRQAESARNAREAKFAKLIHLCQRLLEGWGEDIKDLGSMPNCVTEWSECDAELSRIVGGS
jgi:hypothetical protein